MAGCWTQQKTRYQEGVWFKSRLQDQKYLEELACEVAEYHCTFRWEFTWSKIGHELVRRQEVEGEFAGVCVDIASSRIAEGMYIILILDLGIE